MGTLASGSIDLKSLKVAGEPNKYVTMVDGNGIRVHEAGAVDTNFVQINSSGMQLYNGGINASDIIAQFGETTVIGKNSTSRIYLDNDEIKGVGEFEKPFFSFIGQGPVNTTSLTKSEFSGNKRITENNPMAWHYYYFDNDIPNEATDLRLKLTYNNLYDGSGSHGETYYITKGTAAEFTSTYTSSQSPLWDVTFIIRYDSNGKLYLDGTSTNTDNKCYLKINLDLLYTISTYTPTFTLGSGQATGQYSFSVGGPNVAGGNYSYAEGIETTASGNYSHAEGDNTIARGTYSHAEGSHTIASGSYSHAEGYGTEARYYRVHSQGTNTRSIAMNSFVMGQYNKEDNEMYKLSTDTTVFTNTVYYYKQSDGCFLIVENPSGNPSSKGYYVRNSFTTGIIEKAFIIGNGTSLNNCSNAFTIDWDGNVESAGKTTHVCYINSITSTTISAQNTVKKIPIEAIDDYNDANKYFAYDSSAKGVKIVKDGVYIISVQAGVNPATSGDLMGLNIYKNGSNVIGPEYRRVGGNYDTVILAPTPITLSAGDVLTLYGRNNTSGRGTFTSCRFTIHRI